MHLPSPLASLARLFGLDAVALSTLHVLRSAFFISVGFRSNSARLCMDMNGSRCVLLVLLIGSASAHTNALGFVRSLAGNNMINLTMVYGTYHEGSPPEGALALYGYTSGNAMIASSYTTLAFGVGGSVSDNTHPFHTTSNVAGIDWSKADLNGNSWDSNSLAAVGWNVGVNYLYDGTTGVPIYSHQMTTITMPCASAGNTVRYRPDFDVAPCCGVTPRASLTINFDPCTAVNNYDGCGNFDMTEVIFQIDSSCGVEIQGLLGANFAPSNPPPPPCPAVTTTGSVTTAPTAQSACGSASNGTKTKTVTLRGEGGSVITKIVPVYVGQTTAPQPIKSRFQCCRRDEIGGDACPWELECSCCAADNPWNGERMPLPLWDPLIGAFGADNKSHCQDVLPTCPCCLHPDHPDANLEDRCPDEWMCPPPPPEATIPIAPVAAGIAVACVTLFVFFMPLSMTISGTVLDDLGHPVVGATVQFADGQSRFLKFKGEAQTDFRGKYKLKTRPKAKGGLRVVPLQGYIDNGGGSKSIEMPDKKSKEPLPEDHGDLTLVCPRILSGTVMSDNGVSQVALAGATVDVRMPPQPDTLKKKKLSSMKLLSSKFSPSKKKNLPSPPPSPPCDMISTAPRPNVGIGPVRDDGKSSRIRQPSYLVERPSSPPPSPPQVMPPASPSRMTPNGRRSRVQIEDKEEPPEGRIVQSIATEDTVEAGKPNYKLELLPGTYGITFSAPGHESQVKHVEVGEKGAPNASVMNCTLVPHVYQLYGRILAGASILSGATVLIFDDNGEEISTLTSDDGGGYTLSLRAGSYTRRVILDGYVTKFDRIEVADDTNLDAHLDFVKYDLIGTIESLSKASFDKSDLPAKPLIGAVVSLKDQSGKMVATVRAGEGGRYSLTAPPGDYIRNVTADGHESLLDDPIALASDDQRADATLLVKLHELRGTVMDVDGDVPIAEATVELMVDDEQLVMSVQSGQVGTYAFSLPDASASVSKGRGHKLSLLDLLSSSDEVSAMLMSKILLRRKAAQPRKWQRRVRMAGYVTDVAFHVLTADISETVRLTKAEEIISGMIRGMDGNPLAGALIELFDPRTGQLITSVVADENGTYSMNATHGDFTWLARHEGYVTTTKQLSVSTNFVADATLQAVSHRLTGVVKGGLPTDHHHHHHHKDKKLSRAAVEITPAPKGDEPAPAVAQKPASCMTHGDGSYTVEQLLPGRYVITFKAEDHEDGAAEIVVASEDVTANITLLTKTYMVQGKVTESHSGEAIPYCAVEMLDKHDKKGHTSAELHTTTDEAGVYSFPGMLPGEHKVKIVASGFVVKTHHFSSDKEDVLAGGAGDASLDAIHYSLSGFVTSDSDKICPPVPGAICWLKKAGKIKQRVVCDDRGVFFFGPVPGGLYNIVAGAPGYVKMRGVVNLDQDIKPGGTADLCLPQPLPPEADIGAALASLITPLKSIFQYYCSAAIVGEDNPFQMAFFQLEAFMCDLKLPDGLSKTASPTAVALFDDVNGPTKGTFKFDQRGEVMGALRPDPEKSVDRILTFDEFLDFQVRMAWMCGHKGLLTSRSFPSTRRGLGYALKLYVEEILLPRAQKLEVDPAFEETITKFKVPQAVSKSITKSFEEVGGGTTKFITVDQWIRIMKKWRTPGNQMSIIKLRTLYVQYADDDRGKVPSYVQEIQPTESTLASESASTFEEEEDDDVMEAKAAAAQAAAQVARKEEPGAASEAEAEAAPVEERDALSRLENIRKPRATDQEMTLTEMKAAVCRLAYILCKGKTVGDRLDAFASMHIK